jgi:sec-independent protein translocase protein TatA
MPGPSEWIIVAVIAIAVIFGAKKLPEIARSVGRSQGEFKKGLKEGNVEADRPQDPETQSETAGTTAEQPKNPSTPPPASLN